MTIVPDPGVLLNLVAGECSSKIRKSLEVRFVVPEHCLCAELLFEQEERTREAIESCLAREQIEVESFQGGLEHDYFVEFSMTANEGEAASAAMAAARGWIFATDDALLRDSFSRVSGARTLTTAGLFKRWESHVSQNDVEQAVRLLCKKAGFFCPPEDPDVSWWKSRQQPVSALENQAA